MKGRVLALDYGSRRVGVALSDPLRVLARALTTLPNDDTLLDALLDIIRTEEVSLIIVGMPYAPDGGMGKTAREVKRFIDALAARTQVPITPWDESQTTRQAQQMLIEAGMRQSRRREKLDEIAARIMLQEFLDGAGA